MAYPIETIAGRDGLVLPVINPNQIHSSVFTQFFQELNQLNDFGLREGREIFFPPVAVPASDRIRPALVLKYAKDALPQQQLERNRQAARPGSSDWGQYRAYTTGHEQFTVSSVPTQFGPTEELVVVRQERRSQEVVVGLPSRRSLPPATVTWRGKDIFDQMTPRELELSSLTCGARVLSRFFKRTVKLFAA